MAMREFQIPDVQAQKHSWKEIGRGRCECVRCGALLEVRNGVYYQVYPAHKALDCADLSIDLPPPLATFNADRENTARDQARQGREFAFPCVTVIGAREHAQRPGHCKMASGTSLHLDDKTSRSQGQYVSCQ